MDTHFNVTSNRLQESKCIYVFLGDGGLFILLFFVLLILPHNQGVRLEKAYLNRSMRLGKLSQRKINVICLRGGTEAKHNTLLCDSAVGFI